MNCEFCNKDQEEIHKNLMDKVNKYNYAVLGIFGEQDDKEPDFSYSLGLVKTINHPDFIIFGLPPEISKATIDNIYNFITNEDRTIVPDTPYTEFLQNGVPLVFKKCKKIAFEKYMYKTDWYNNEVGCENIAYQIVWPDQNNLFPWDDGFDEKWIPKVVNLYD